MVCVYCKSLDWRHDGYDYYCGKCGVDQATSRWRRSCTCPEPGLFVDADCPTHDESA